MCARCEQLEEEVAYLRSELGLQRDADEVSRLRDALLVAVPVSSRGRYQPAELLAALYRAKGRPVTRAQLLDAIPSPSGGDREERIVDVWACIARKAVGNDAIATVWGRGYRLTEAGMATIAEILGRPAVRGLSLSSSQAVA